MKRVVCRLVELRQQTSSPAMAAEVAMPSHIDGIMHALCGTINPQILLNDLHVRLQSMLLTTLSFGSL